MQRSPLILALILGAFALLAVGWFLGRGLSPAPPASAGQEDAPLAAATGSAADALPGKTDANTTAATPSAAVAAAPTAPGGLAPLPPADAALADVFDELLQRARGGDSRAACRLASDLQRCQRAAREAFAPDFLERRAAQERDEERRESMIEYLASMEERSARSESLCAGVTPQQIDHAFELQLQAAQADPALRLWTALNPALDAQFFVNDLERWQQYRLVARPWLEAAAAEGDVAAVIALARVHGDGRRQGPMSPPLRQLDDARFVTYATLMERYGLAIPPVQRALEDARVRLDASALEDAERRAAALFRPDRVVVGGREGVREAMRRSFNLAPDAADCE